MEVFNNQQRSGYEEIVSYGPKWWTEFREMDANYRFAGWTLDLMAYWLERVVNNQFPANADERTITTVFEPALGIEPEPDETLEERRKTVAAYWSGTGKLSKTVIQSIIKAYTGCESELWWNGIKLQIRIFCDEDGQFSQRKIHNIISRRYPAHLSFTIRDMICTFVLEEQIIYNRIRHRTQITWWDETLNGSNALDGAAELSAELPPFFTFKYPVAVENGNEIAFPKMKYRAGVQHEMQAEIFPVHRVLLNWWEGYGTLDGMTDLDGSLLLDHTMPPVIKETYRMDIGTQEDIGVNLFIPAHAKPLNGDFALDGTINLNSGREEL